MISRKLALIWLIRHKLLRWCITNNPIEKTFSRVYKGPNVYAFIWFDI